MRRFSKDAWISYFSVLLLSFIPVILLPRHGLLWGAVLLLAFYCGAMGIVALLCSLGEWRFRRVWVLTGKQIQDTHVFIRVFGGLLDGR